jgi:hypothetical protein
VLGRYLSKSRQEGKPVARAKLTEISDDLINDAGSVLWSFVKGEQLEFMITLNFITDASDVNYQFEAVSVEALNVAEQSTKPVTIQPGGVGTALTVRRPNLIGTWNAGTAYNTEDVVLYSGVYYKLSAGTARVSATLPSVDPLWVVTTLNRVYIQFPGTLGTGWAVAPAVGYPVYSFFELRVTEPNNSILRRTWKPVRGMIELLFSPTDSVADP